MVKIQELPTGQLTITIPKKLAEFKRWRKGMQVEFREYGPESVILEIRGDASNRKQ